MEKKNNELVEIEEFDAFTHLIKQSIEYIEKNRTNILIGLGVFVAAIVLIIGGSAWISNQKALASLELQKSVRVLGQTENLNEKKLENIFQTVRSKYKNYKAAGFANLTIARKLYSMDKKAESIKYFKLAKDKLDGSRFLSDIIDYEIAMAMMPDKKNSEYLNKIVKDKTFLEEDALFQLSLQGDKKALESLKQKDFSTGFYANLIKENL